MKMQMRDWKRIGMGLLLICFVSGCASDMTLIVAKPPVNAQKLGRVEGEAMGSRVFAFFPIGENSRTIRAYNNALEKAPGATALMDVTIQEDWIWWYLGTSRTVTITGEAVK